MFDDDDYDPLDGLPPQEEPDCYPCGDSRTVRAGRLNRLVGRRWVRCPSCDPSRITRLYQRSGLWRVRGWAWRLFHRAQLSDEAPF